MALKSVAAKGKTRFPSDSLAPMDQEAVYNLIRQALGISLLIETDPDDDHPAVSAAGGIVTALSKARLIMEMGSEAAVRRAEASYG